MQQILTYAGVRDRLEEAFDKIREAKATLRDHQFSYKQMEREEHQARYGDSILLSWITWLGHYNSNVLV